MLKCFHGSLYTRHVVIVKGFCNSRSQNLLLRKWPIYTKSKLECQLIHFPDLIIYCAYRFEWFYFSQSGGRFRDFPLSLSHFKLECRCSLASKTLSQAQRQSSGPVPTAFHHLLIGPSAAETGLSRLSSLPLRLASLSTPVFGTFNFPFLFFFVSIAGEVVPGIRWQVLVEVMMTQRRGTEWIKMYWEI